MLVINIAVIKLTMPSLVEEFWKVKFVHDMIVHFIASIFSLELEGNYFLNIKNVKAFHGIFLLIFSKLLLFTGFEEIYF